MELRSDDRSIITYFIIKPRLYDRFDFDQF